MKTETQRRRLRWTLKIANILLWGGRTPPLTARKSNALNILPTAMNSRTDRVFPSDSQHCSIAFSCYQGKSLRDGCFITSGLESKNRQSLRLAFFELSAGRDRLGAAIFLACFVLFPAFPLCSIPDFQRVDVDAGSCNKQPKEQRNSWHHHNYQIRLWCDRKS